MSERISDSVLLVGLIIKTKPFTYSNDVVSCSYESHVNIDELKELRETIASELTAIGEEALSDETHQEIHKDLYFIDTVILELQSRIN
jgi:hypothetical protein